MNELDIFDINNVHNFVQPFPNFTMVNYSLNNVKNVQNRTEHTFLPAPVKNMLEVIHLSFLNSFTHLADSLRA